MARRSKKEGMHRPVMATPESTSLALMGVCSIEPDQPAFNRLHEENSQQMADAYMRIHSAWRPLLVLAILGLGIATTICLVNLSIPSFWASWAVASSRLPEDLECLER